MATIHIVDLKVRTIIGTHPWERKNKQELIINLSLQYDAQAASLSDKLKDALDYEQIAKAIVDVAQNSRCLLLESLAGKMVKKLKTYKGLQGLSLRIDKPLALANARCVSYQISL